MCIETMPKVIIMLISSRFLRFENDILGLRKKSKMYSNNKFLYWHLKLGRYRINFGKTSTHQRIPSLSTLYNQQLLWFW